LKYAEEASRKRRGATVYRMSMAGKKIQKNKISQKVTVCSGEIRTACKRHEEANYEEMGGEWPT